MNTRIPRVPAIGATLLLVAAICGLAPGGQTGSQDVSGKVQLSQDEDVLPWRCHHYSESQGDDWCKKVGVQDGWEYDWVGADANICGECWCCKRQTLGFAPAPTPAPTPAATPAPESKKMLSSSLASTKAPEPAPTPMPTPMP